MKKSQIWLWLLLIPLSMGVVLNSCSDDEDDPCTAGNKTELDQAIDDAQVLHDDAVEGTDPGEYLPGSKDALQASINLATDVRNTQCVTQQQLDAAVVALDAAVDAFESQLITGVAPEALVAHWLFNGDGTDATGNGHDGTASAGHAEWGGGMPALAADRFGNADYCYLFADGANFVVSNSPAFKPTAMTISVWMNMTDTWANNYFFSNDIWHCYKFQVQDANKPYGTVRIANDDGSGDTTYIDRDSNTGILELATWYQVVISYESGKMTFYIDGAKVEQWEDFPTGTITDPHPGIDVCIGQALPTADFDNGAHEWQEWLGHFKGYMDDMRFYNVVLTDAQVQSNYNYEKDNAVE